MDLPPGFIHNNHTHSHREYARVLLIFCSDTGLHAADRHVAAFLHHQHDDQHLHPHHRRLAEEGGVGEEERDREQPSPAHDRHCELLFQNLADVFDCSSECFARIYNCSGNPQWSKDLPPEEKDGEGQACEDDRRQDGQQGLHHCIPYCIHHLYWLHGDSGMRKNIIMFWTIKHD